MAQEGRSILAMILRNFINSLRPRQIRGTLMGKDHLGNAYYELPPVPRLGKRRASRWFEPTEKDNFEQEVPAEWEAWLRGRRDEPPQEEEVLKNVAIIEMKRKNAQEIATREAKGKDAQLLDKDIKGMESFPKYEEYEVMPGKQKLKK